MSDDPSRPAAGQDGAEALPRVAPPAGVSADFVFGTLATDDLRLAQLRAASTGVRHGHDLEPPDPWPGRPVLVRVSVGPDVDVDHVTCYYTTDGRDPDGHRGRASVGSAVDLARAAVQWDTLSWAYTETWAGELPPQPAGTLVRYRIEAWSSDRRVAAWAEDVTDVRTPAAAASGLPRRDRFAYHVDEYRVPDWLRDAVIYQVFVDRFAPGGGRPFAQPSSPGGFYGGTLRGVTEHLAHVEEVGATCIWLSPVFPSPSHHGYDATDYGSIEPRMGTIADLRSLVEAAHARGIRVILDYVVNHVSSGHEAFRRARADAASPEAGWFLFERWPDEYQTFFGVRDHPRIDSDDAGARQYMLDHARRWLNLGVDGFRCDYANGPSHAFWSAFRAATRATRVDSIAIGEVVETPELQRTYRGRLDGCLDFILLQALRRFFAFGDVTASQLDTFLSRHLAYADGDFVLPSFLDNHDMNRFLWAAGGDVRRLRLAALCQFVLPGPPIVYYGTEVGLAQQRDVRYADGSGHPEESRLPMRWGEGQDRDLLAFYGRLARLRRSHAALWRRERRTIRIDDAHGVLAWMCADGTTSAIVAINSGDGLEHVRVDAPGTWTQAIATDDDTRFEGGSVTLPPRSGAVLLGVVAGEPGSGEE